MRGFVSVDWAIGAMIFFLFTAIAYTHYVGLFPTRYKMTETMESITDDILENLKIKTYTVPLKFVSDNTTINKVLFLNFSWSENFKNSTRVLKGDEPQPCLFIGNTLYWQSNVTKGLNNFTLTFSKQDIPLRCNRTFSIVNESLVIPWITEESFALSNAKVSEMLSVSYQTFKSRLGINRDFRIEINVSGNLIAYGKPVPNASTVYGKERQSHIEETGQKATVRVFVW